MKAKPPTRPDYHYGMEKNGMNGNGRGNAIPVSEWRKIAEYVGKGSDFRAVGAACRDNPVKQRSRYLILKAIGLGDAADRFLAGLEPHIGYAAALELRALSPDGISVPQKCVDLYADLCGAADSISEAYAASRNKSAKAHCAGPLKELARMGVDYVTVFSDGSGSTGDKARITELLGEIPTYRPSGEWARSSGLRWDVPLTVVMLNGRVKGWGKRYFGYVAHTLESGGANPGYSVFGYFSGSSVSGDSLCWSVTECSDWIRQNVEKDVTSERGPGVSA